MHHRLLRAARAFLVAGLALAPTAALLAELPPLIPRTVLFGNPERATPRLSLDGKRLAWIAPNDKGVLQVWVKTIGQNDDKVLTADKKRGIRQFFWTQDNKTIIYLQDNDGDENIHLFGIDLETGTVRDYTPFVGARATPARSDPSQPDQILVSMNARDKRLFDIYRLTLSTGALVLDTKNPGDVLTFLIDKDLRVRGGEVTKADGGTEIRLYENGEWKTWLSGTAEDDLTAIDVTPDGKGIVLQSSVGRDTSAIVVRNIADGAEKVIASSPLVDAENVEINPNTHAIEAVAFAPGRSTWTVVDPAVKADFDAIAKLYDGDFNIVSRDRTDKTWLVAFISDRSATRYYTYDRATKSGTFLFTGRPKLDDLQLAPMKHVVITSRDGLKLNSYLTLPVGVEPKNLPLVLFVHGGPWGRDSWGYSGFVQWLANRGYAVLQVNFRASTGYGKKFLHAGDRQWGGTMQNDLTDAVQWAIKQGYADPKRVAIMGGSYGGYATLAGLTVTPDLYACGVDMFGPVNLKTLLGSIPPYWTAMRKMFDARMGNIDDPKDAEVVKNQSPLYKADRIKKPLLIGQGTNDPRVKPAESEQIVEAIEKSGGSVTYVVYSDEGHGFARPENSIDFNARAESFLAQCLGGRAEPLAGEKNPGSTAVVKVVAAKK